MLPPDQADEAAAHDAITGPHGEVVSSASPDPEDVIADGAAPAERPWGWKLQEAVEEWLSYIAVLSSAQLPANVLINVLSWRLQYRPYRVRRWIEIEANRSELFYEMPEEERERLRA